MGELNIPRATAKRLPLYYRFLENLHAMGKARVSSSELSEAVKVDAATIRRDFSYFGALGKKGYGYNVSYLLQFFREILQQDEQADVILVGVGNLGTALLHYKSQRKTNNRIIRAYDVDPKKVGQVFAEVPIYALDDLIHHPVCEVAILTVPASVAQKTTDLLLQAGVKGILNFTPARLDVPASIRVHHIDLSIELQSLIYFLKHYPLSAEQVEEENNK